VRTRALLQALSIELFGVNLALPDFPRVRSIRGIGTSDPNQYASRLAEKLDYRNTFFNREPRFDIMHPAEEERGKYDFLISSEVFEHVAAPVDLAFHNVHDLLKPSGVAVFTVPYSVEESMQEHFPDLHEFGFAQVGDHFGSACAASSDAGKDVDAVVSESDRAEQPNGGRLPNARLFSHGPRLRAFLRRDAARHRCVAAHLVPINQGTVRNGDFPFA